MCTLLTASMLFKSEASTGEGAIWHPGRNSLFWVDIEGQTLFEYLPQENNCRKWSFDRMVSTVVPESNISVVVALQNEIVRLELETGQLNTIALIDDMQGKGRCNDGKCDPEGRFWIGTIAKKAPTGSAKLYTVLQDGTVTTKISNVTNSNGIVWTSDKKYMYYIDTPTRQVSRYLYDVKTGNIELDGIAVSIPENTGKPDGMTIDKNGNLWIGQWGGYGVYCYNPVSGELLSKIEVPVPNVPSCAFGGENLETLYITTARGTLSTDELIKYPDSGSLFVCKPGVQGVSANYFTK
ncbi:MAG: SMP-30/gluconolactonase/LRE family protein [Tannerellaceae bacterium]|nr:SMP-30/gluconolactonase/LRE family protein [Tannerellaceae bacterium]